MILVLCCGTRKIDKPAVYHDVLDTGINDIQCDLFEIGEHIMPGSVNELHFTHALEHFPMSETLDVLELLHSLLKDKGKLYIEVPNYKWHAQMILEDPLNRQIVEYSFGGQKDKYDYHYNGFTPEILREDLEGSGFSIQSLEPNSSIECWAVKNG